MAERECLQCHGAGNARSIGQLGRRVVHTCRKTGWKTHAVLCGSCLREHWRDYTKLEPQPGTVKEWDDRNTEIMNWLRDLLARQNGVGVAELELKRMWG